MKKFLKLIFNWKFLSRISIVLGIIGGLGYFIGLISNSSSKNDISATIEINKNNIPVLIKTFTHSIDTFDIKYKFDDIKEDCQDSINKYILSFSDTLFNLSLKTKSKDIAKLSGQLYRLTNISDFFLNQNSNKIKKLVKPFINKDNIEKIQNYSNVVKLNIINNDESEAKNLMLKIQSNFLFENCYYEISQYNKVTQSSFFKDTLKLPDLSGKESVFIQIWCGVLFKEDIKITTSNDIIYPSEIIGTTGFYAWAYRHLNSWTDFYLIIIAPLLIISYIAFMLLIYKYRKKQIEEDNSTEIEKSELTNE